MHQFVVSEESKELKFENGECGVSFAAQCENLVHVCTLRCVPFELTSLLQLGNRDQNSRLYKLPKCLIGHIVSFIEFSVEVEKCDVSLEEVQTIVAHSGPSFPVAARLLARHGNIVA
jgi:hypothetical protein